MDKIRINNLLKSNNFFDIEIVEEIESTSKYLLENNKLFKKNKVLIALNQTNGVGQYGRKYYCYENDGLYFSLLLKKYHSNINVSQLTMIFSIIIVEVFNELYQKDLKIKWVNDIFYENRKVAGILIQTTYDENELDVVVGIGINLFKPTNGFNKVIDDIAGAIFTDEKIDKDMIITCIINKFINYYFNDNIKEIHQKYLSKSLVLKKSVYLNDELVYIDNINEDGSLEVIKNGEILNVVSGRIKLGVKK
ncbi:BirA family biotin operon repressor/biotin-[acetyl-CoA-carboxylase] ligase [Bacilli bacterium PM5-9]|nr:BirA family biotin operon repressor/biotin-[acetyl-CoA-carboxylase] ligase [Bacilli bacterium PM5-9]